MQYTVERLVSGDSHVSEYYRRAVERWKEIWARPESKDLMQLAELLDEEEKWFDEHCGGKEHPWGSKEIMVLAGIGMLYSTRDRFNGNVERAQFLYSAIQRSFCSIEVQSIARDVAKSYGLLEARVA